jgi:hypothetical protein
MTFKQGDQVFYRPREDAAVRAAPMIGSTGAFQLPQHLVEEMEKGKSFKRRAAVDKVLSTGQYRLVLNDTFDTVLAEQVEGMDVVTKIGDFENSKSVEDQLAEQRKYESDGPETVVVRQTNFARFKARTAFFCNICHERSDAGSVGYKPTESRGWTMSAPLCLRCVVEGRLP